METFLTIAFFLFGLVFGSFLNVCIYRLPRELSVVSPRSMCPNCGTAIAFYDNIPVLSWIILRGRCRNCKQPISPRYAIVELLTGFFFALSYLLAGPDAAIAFKLSVFSFFLIGLIFTDAETKLLPDLLTKPGIAVGLAFSLVTPVEGPARLFLPAVDNWRILSLMNSIAGAVLGSAFILCVALAYEALRGVEGMGRGDVKLMALIGAFLGVKLTLLVLLLGSLVGSCFGLLLIVMVWRKRMARRRRQHPAEPAGASRRRAWQSAVLIYRNFEIPFGVFLGAGGLVAAFCGPALLRWYMQFYR
ncbi:MAG TPA: prepilin peptidase [Candidatus Limnocylindrales bacterium]|nr:prepilin peptidase [Candidatus Limnocylindrales bacterium]